MIKNILFDFDGTLVDTREGIVNCLNYSLDNMGITPIQEQIATALIGIPLEDMFTRLLNDDNPDLIEKCVGYFRERYSTQGLLELKLYPSVKETLHFLMIRNITLNIVTSKPYVFTRTICKNLNIDKYFTHISGVELLGKSQSKSNRVKIILDKFGFINSQTIMVGDRAEDIIAAHNNKLCSVGLLHGFGHKEELLGAGCDVLCNDFTDFAKYIIKTKSFC